MEQPRTPHASQHGANTMKLWSQQLSDLVSQSSKMGFRQTARKMQTHERALCALGSQESLPDEAAACNGADLWGAAAMRGLRWPDLPLGK